MSEREINECGEYLMRNYYPRYKGKAPKQIPTFDQIRAAFLNHEDKIVVVRDENIKGIGIFLRLTDETYKNLRDMDMTDEAIMFQLLMECGENIHFVLLCADNYRTIMTGLRTVKYKYNPKTISWWNPDLTMLHTYQGE